jgi:hypothetical protein
LKVIKLIDKKLFLPSVTIQKCVLYVKEIGHNPGTRQSREEIGREELGDERGETFRRLRGE